MACITDNLYIGIIEMALNPYDTYPGNTTPPDVEYPYGSAQNVTVSGDGTGTPWRKDVVDDIWGFQQALLKAAGDITPSGNADRVGASQYLDAINFLISAGGSQGSRYNVSVNNNTTISFDSSNNLDYQELTNASPINITMLAPVAPFGDTITIDKAAGSGDITIVGDAGITVETIVNGSLVITDDGQVASLVSKSATVWKLVV